MAVSLTLSTSYIICFAHLDELIFIPFELIYTIAHNIHFTGRAMVFVYSVDSKTSSTQDVRHMSTKASHFIHSAVSSKRIQVNNKQIAKTTSCLPPHKGSLMWKCPCNDVIMNYRTKCNAQRCSHKCHPMYWSHWWAMKYLIWVTVKPVCNDHIYNKFYYPWCIQ